MILSLAIETRHSLSGRKLQGAMPEKHSYAHQYSAFIFYSLDKAKRLSFIGMLGFTRPKINEREVHRKLWLIVSYSPLDKQFNRDVLMLCI